jgi:hypothetical protein
MWYNLEWIVSYILIHLVCPSVSLGHERELGMDWARIGHALGTGTGMGGIGHRLGRAKHSMGGLGPGEGHNTGRLGMGGHGRAGHGRIMSERHVYPLVMRLKY